VRKICFLAGSLLCVPVFAQLPSAAAPHVSEPHSDVEMQTHDWKAANDQVGQFLRGHADVVKWERSMRTADPKPDGSLGGGPELLQADAAVRIALLNTPQQLAAQGAAQLAAQTRKAWINAVAAQQSASYLRDAKEAAEAGAELARRMVRTGNWSRLEQAREQLYLSDATTELARAEQKAFSARAQLSRLLGLPGMQAGLTLAGRLPDLPQAASVVDAPQTRQTPEASEAHFAYRAAYDLAVYYRDNVVPLHQLIHEEMVLRYSGMLVSVWELLAETREQVLATNNALEAQRDFWLAEADLQTALSGTSAAALAPSASGASAEAPTLQGH